MEIRMVETLGVRQAASVNHVLVVKSAGGLVCEHSESQMERAHSKWVIWGPMKTGTIVKVKKEESAVSSCWQLWGPITIFSWKGQREGVVLRNWSWGLQWMEKCC